MTPTDPAHPAEAPATAAPAALGATAPALNAAASPEVRAALLAWVRDRLHEAHGPRPLVARRDAMHELVATMLSGRTTHDDEEAAYAELRALGDWDAIAGAPVEAVAHAIRRSNYAETKAPRIQAALKRIRDATGGHDLDFLRTMPLAEALKWLTDLPGVGIKTASLLLLFNFARPVFPVDTHVHRIATRVGAIARMGEQPAHRALRAVLPPDPPFLYELHKNLLRHGQQVCRWTRPACARCVLRERCHAFAVHGDRVPAFGAS